MTGVSFLHFIGLLWVRSPIRGCEAECLERADQTWTKSQQVMLAVQLEALMAYSLRSREPKSWHGDRQRAAQGAATRPGMTVPCGARLLALASTAWRTETIPE